MKPVYEALALADRVDASARAIADGMSTETVQCTRIQELRCALGVALTVSEEAREAVERHLHGAELERVRETADVARKVA